MVPPQFTAKRGLIRSQQTVSAISGAPVSTYCIVQQSRSERYSAHIFLLPCTKRQLSERRVVARTIFHHRVYLTNFTTFSRQSQRETNTIIIKKHRLFLCILTWTCVCPRWNIRTATGICEGIRRRTRGHAAAHPVTQNGPAVQFFRKTDIPQIRS